MSQSVKYENYCRVDGINFDYNNNNEIYLLITFFAADSKSVFIFKFRQLNQIFINPIKWNFALFYCSGFLHFFSSRLSLKNFTQTHTHLRVPRPQTITIFFFKIIVS